MSLIYLIFSLPFPSSHCRTVWVHPNAVSPSAFAAVIDDTSLSLSLLAAICCCAAFAQKKSTRMRYLCDDSSSGRFFSPRCTLSPSPSRSPCNAHLMPPKKFTQSIGGASNCLLPSPVPLMCLLLLLLLILWHAANYLSLLFYDSFCAWWSSPLRATLGQSFPFSPPPAPSSHHALPRPATSHGRRRNRVAVCCMRCLFVSAIPNEARAGAANEQANEPRALWGRGEREGGDSRGSGRLAGFHCWFFGVFAFFALSLQSRCNILFSIRI